ncbi:hypothetical protein HC864_00105 [Candidatus Gracilibacteria bacterium]|nr:hypothetical protein [Candidatus Gracilibacteria bacterium]
MISKRVLVNYFLVYLNLTIPYLKILFCLFGLFILNTYSAGEILSNKPVESSKLTQKQFK